MRPTNVLLVEDDPFIQEWINADLNDAGFEVVVADNGSDAMAELHANATRFVAVITDIQLGSGANGWDIGRLARHLVPDMPMVYISGDSGHDWLSNGVPHSVMIAKPFVTAHLIITIRALISDPGTNRSADARAASNLSSDDAPA